MYGYHIYVLIYVSYSLYIHTTQIYIHIYMIYNIQVFDVARVIWVERPKSGFDKKFIQVQRENKLKIKMK